MMATTHAFLGAVIGHLTQHRGKAFAGGVASHLLADLVPHKDFPLRIEAPLLLISLGLLSWRFGWKSPEVIGACGAVSPDIENGLAVLKVLHSDRMLFPTHQKSGWLHAPPLSSALPQGALVLACVAYLLLSSQKKDEA